MATTHEVVAGQTSDYDIELKDDGQIPSGTLEGTIELILRNAAGVQLAFTGDVSIADPVTWRVRVSPDAGDFIEGIYRGRIKVTDLTGKIAYFPSGLHDTWIVHPETF